MGIIPKTCKITKGSTLKEVARFLKLEPEQLRSYHNQHCPYKQDYIGDEIPPHVEIIYFPPLDEKIRAQIFQKQQPVFPDILQLEAPYTFKNRYGIIQKKYDLDRLITEISYEMDVLLISKNNYKVNKGKTTIDRRDIDLTLEKLGDEIGSIFYPLELKTYNSGLLQEIENYQEIKKRWISKKNSLGVYYKGRVVNEIFERVDRQILRKGTTQRKILESLFYNLYFFPLYERYKENKYNTTLRIPLAGEGRVPFEIASHLDKNVSPGRKIHIAVKGKTLEENEEFYPYRGSLDLDYKLNVKDYSICSIIGALRWQNINEKKAQTIEFELYQL